VVGVLEELNSFANMGRALYMKAKAFAPTGNIVPMLCVGTRWNGRAYL